MLRDIAIVVGVGTVLGLLLGFAFLVILATP